MFWIGQKVVCLKNLGRNNPAWWAPIDKDAILTVRGIFLCPSENVTALAFHEVSNRIHPVHQIEMSYEARWFRPLVERKTDIRFAHEILRKATKPAPARTAFQDAE